MDRRFLGQWWKYHSLRGWSAAVRHHLVIRRLYWDHGPVMPQTKVGLSLGEWQTTAVRSGFVLSVPSASPRHSRVGVEGWRLQWRMGDDR